MGGYPTDLNAMSNDWIDRLSLRGEQLTTCLARAYIPHLIDEDGPANRARTDDMRG
jgi:NTE family protein